MARLRRYRPEHDEIVIENGANRFNRPLYGSNSAFFVYAGDLPEFMMSLPGKGGTLWLGLVAGVAAMGATVRARHTVTFAHLKLGHVTGHGARLGGRVHVVDLGVPSTLRLEHTASLVEAKDVRRWLVSRRHGDRCSPTKARVVAVHDPVALNPGGVSDLMPIPNRWFFGITCGWPDNNW